MSEILVNFAVRPLFYEVLTGEFVPATDPKRSHTLAKLLVATFHKGKFELNTDSNPGYPTKKYNPSWAPGVLAVVDYDTHDGIAIPAGIYLKSEHDDKSLHLADESSSDELKLHIGTDLADSSYTLALGSEIVTAREAATQAAQNFFSE